MAGDIGLNSEIQVGRRKLHLQTSFDPESHKANVSIFDGGQLVDIREMSVEDKTPPATKEQEVRNFHELVLSDLELLFFVANKVKAAKQPAAIKKLGNLFLEKGFYEEAIEHFALALKMDPAHQDCHYNLARAFFQKRDYQAALENLLIASRETPDYADIHLLLGKVYWHVGQCTMAIGEIKRAVELNSAYHQAHFALGLYLIESSATVPRHVELAPPIERIKNGIEHLRRAMAISNTYNRKIMQAGFEKLEGEKKLEEALSDFVRAYDPPPANIRSSIADGEFYLKFMFAGLGKDNKTLDHYIRAIEKTVAQHPKYADLHRSLGTAYLINGWHYFIKAVEEFREAIKINPSFDKAKKSLKLLENDSRGFLILLRAILK
jgi:tetratricopeptide (TPR) repeat protein